MGLQKRASLLGGLGLLFLVGILASIGVWAVRETTQRSLNERVAISQMVARGVDQTLLTAEGELNRLSLMFDLEDANTSSDQQLLANLYTFSGTFSYVFLLDSAGKVIASEPSSISEEADAIIAADPGISRVLRTRSAAVSSVSASVPDDNLAFSISVPVFGKADGSIVGIVTGYTEASRVLGSLTQPLGLGSTAFMEVVNEEGRVMATSQGPVLASPERTEYAAHFVSLIQEGKATMETCFRCHDNAGTVARSRDVLAFAPLSTATGGVAIRQSEAEALAPSRRLVQYLLLTGIPLFGLGLVFTWLSTRTVVRPVLQLTAASKRIAEGDLANPITVTRQDELGLLAQALDRMRSGLKESLAEKEARAVESEKLARQLAILNAIAATVGHSLDLEQILQDSLRQVQQFLSIESGCIYLKDHDSPSLQMKARHNMSEEWLNFISQQSGEAGMTQNVMSFEQVTGGTSVTFIRIPLISKAQALGIMYLGSPGPRWFTDDEISLLTSIGHQIGVAVDNARLFQETGQREKEAQALHQLGIEISRLLDLDRILTTVVDSSRHLLEAGGSILALYDERTSEVCVRATSGLPSSEFNNLRMKDGEDSLIGRVLSLGSSISTLDYLNDANFSHTPELDNIFRKNNFKSCLMVPLKIGEGVRGILMTVYPQKSSFSHRETELLQQLANQAAVALENARLYNQIQELAIVEERARISREMHDSLGQVLGYLGLKVDETGLLLASEQRERVTQTLGEIRKVLRDTLDEVRHSILALRTPVLSELELPSMLRDYLEVFRQQTNIVVSLNIQDEKATRFSPRVALQLVRVIQEALSNVRKHARANQVEVKFEVVDAEMVVSIADNGIGFEPPSTHSRGQHFGLQVMNERMGSVGGSLEIISSTGCGTRVLARLPLEKRDGD